MHDNADTIIQANSPKQHIPAQPAKNGILLIHGLLDSPFLLQGLYEHFKTQGYVVRSLLLPGHGTVPGDLLDVNLESWLQASEFAVKQFESEVENLYLLGFSTGASLALYHAYQGANIKGLILFAPALKFVNRLAALTRWLPGNWLRLAPETDFAKYQSIPNNAVYQVYRLSRKLITFSQNQENRNPLD